MREVVGVGVALGEESRTVFRLGREPAEAVVDVGGNEACMVSLGGLVAVEVVTLFSDIQLLRCECQYINTLDMLISIMLKEPICSHLVLCWRCRRKRLWGKGVRDFPINISCRHYSSICNISLPLLSTTESSIFENFPYVTS